MLDVVYIVVVVFLDFVVVYGGLLGGCLIVGVLYDV